MPLHWTPEHFTASPRGSATPSSLRLRQVLFKPSGLRHHLRMADRWDETWHRLRVWTSGQAASERLAGQVLLADGFHRLDPSHPLGGRDRKKDAIVWLGDEKWIMAVHFSRKRETLARLARKVRHDASDVASDREIGLVFVTNQEILLEQRAALAREIEPVRLDLYHLERIAAVLDQPRMASTRKQFLAIRASASERWDGFYEAPEMPEGWPRKFPPPEEDEFYSDYLDDPDDFSWKIPRECTCGLDFTDQRGGDWQWAWGDGREYLEGAIPAGLDEDDLLNPVVWHWLNLLWDAAEAQGGESFSVFESRKSWFDDKRDRREWVQAIEAAQAEFDGWHPSESNLVWHRPWR
jgi:hypothetical protein